jgi:hypothetical protein
MLVRPSDLAERMSSTQRPETFKLPIYAARLKAREILDQLPQAGYVAVVEKLAAASRRSDRIHEAVARKARAGSLIQGDKVRSVVTPDDYASESEAELAAQKLIKKL